MDLRHEIAGKIEQFYSRALEFSASARKLIFSRLAGGFDVRRKPDRSYVTSADLEVEQHLRGLIQGHFPEHGVIGEEFPPANPTADFQWIMDPIDGTEDFVQRMPAFGSILALHYRGQPVVGVIDHPVLDINVSAAFGLGARHNGRSIRLADIDASAIDGSERVMLPARANFTKHRDDGALFDRLARAHPNHRIYRSCFTHSCAVLGMVEAAVDYGNAVWDLAASRVLIEEAGGKFILVQERQTPGFGWVYGAVMGKPTMVDRLAAHFNS